MSKHTPGPWTLNGNTVEDTQKHTSLIAHVEARENEDHVANARLIAAAPDLLAALEHLMRYDFGQSEGAIEARAAIAKARGDK